MAKVVILNGPANCGKDTIANRLSNGRDSMCKMEFKQPLYWHAAAAIQMDYDEFMNHYEDREWKERRQFNGRSVRDIMISVSEDFLKPLFGNDYFGKRLAKSCTDSERWCRNGFIISDGGFVEEVEAVRQAGHDVVLIHVYRDGCSFEGDSRNYVLTNCVPRIYTLYNNGSIEEAVAEVERILDEHRQYER